MDPQGLASVIEVIGPQMYEYDFSLGRTCSDWAHSVGTKYSNIVAFCLFLYDYALTFSDEVQSHYANPSALTLFIAGRIHMATGYHIW